MTLHTLAATYLCELIHPHLPSWSFCDSPSRLTIKPSHTNIPLVRFDLSGGCTLLYWTLWLLKCYVLTVYIYAICSICEGTFRKLLPTTDEKCAAVFTLTSIFLHGTELWFEQQGHKQHRNKWQGNMSNTKMWDEQMSNTVTHCYGAMLCVEALRDTLTRDVTTWQWTAWRHTIQRYSKHSNRLHHQATLWQGDKCHHNKATSNSQRINRGLQQWHGDRMTRNSVTSDMDKQLHAAIQWWRVWFGWWIWLSLVALLTTSFLSLTMTSLSLD